ncbi:hypothetical protein FOVSG1_012316 [Fusarium oxysporum f. sp. vasinfectum]
MFLYGKFDAPSDNHVESNLGKIFALATKWQAILLLDEADVFLESGGRGNKVLSTDRNALVSGTTKLGERKKPPTTRESSLVEIDAAFARTLGLSGRQEVTVALYLESPLVDTVNIEPLTREDWEIIELHASFLEFGLIRQVRALPNSGYNSSGGSGHSDHPITLHLTPTTTANLKLVSPHPDPNSPFVKLGPNPESLLHQKRERETFS